MDSLFINLFFLVCAFLLTYYIVPRIRGVVEFKRLMDDPNERSSHSTITPTLGGIAFYITIVIGLYFIAPYDGYNFGISLMPGLTILFITGLKDDLVSLSPISKILAQIAASAFVLYSGLVETSEFHFFGIQNKWIFYPLLSFLMITLINAYNLIDGIDGLATIVGIVIVSVFSIVFYFIEDQFFFILTLVLIGCLLAFLRFNLSDKQKIFMGDTGSLLIGFMISVLTVRFLSISAINVTKLPFKLENLPFIAIAVLIVPLFDTARVFTIRVLNKKSPFSPDRNHVHHILIDLGFSHKKSSFFIGVLNAFFVVVFLVLGSEYTNIGIIIGLVIAILVFLYVIYLFDRRYANLKRKSKVRKFKKKILKK